MVDTHLPARWIWFWVVGYVGLAAAVVWSMIAAHRWALTDLATPQAVQDWQTWREDVRGEEGRRAPVHRRVPTSSEPPMLVLLRDHFAVMLTAAIVFSTVLFSITAWLLSGMLTTPTHNQGQPEPDHSRRP